MAKPILRVEKLSFSYANEQVFRDFSLSVEAGNNIAIKGESGTGKTTLFRLLMGFEKPEQGRILFKGEPIGKSGYSKLRTQTAWLPQDLNLGTGFVKDVILFPFTFDFNVNKKPGEKEILDILSTLNLNGDVLEKRFSDLSTGQRQRIGFAICILLEKPLLLLDEPTSALDAASKKQIFSLLANNRERTIISTSHDPWWLERCDKIVELNNVQQSKK